MAEFTFWRNNHPLTPTVDALSEKFIPMSGATAWVQAECFRAALKLHHDYYNNGFGNEMSQPIAYLDQHFAASASPEWRDAFVPIREGAMEPWNKSDDLDDDFVLVIAEVALALKAADEAGTLIPLDGDMWTMPRKLIEWPAHEDEEDIYAEEID